jgi:hypothetical protein
LSHKRGYDIGPVFGPGDIEEGNPFTENTPRLKLVGRKDQIEEFYKVKIVKSITTITLAVCICGNFR